MHKNIYKQPEPDLSDEQRNFKLLSFFPEAQHIDYPVVPMAKINHGPRTLSGFLRCHAASHPHTSHSDATHRGVA